ncbi:hypothetical protein E8E11_001381 [Didymella keratinophila]|nr:hypothetical protein E8E11_001381 [Didymella keratinophila]
MRLCDLCTKLESRVYQKYRQRGSRWCPIYTHQPRRENGDSSIRSSAEAGCYFSSRFWSSLSSQHRETILSPDFSGLIVSLFWSEKEGRFTQLHYVMGIEFDDCDGEVLDTFDLLPTTSHTRPSAALHTSKIVPCWLRTCLTKHKECFTGPPEWLPTRLIDIGDACDDDLARLVLTEGLRPSNCLYLTLSHGHLSDMSAALTTTNVQGYQNEIVLREPPRLFQLTVRAAKML